MSREAAQVIVNWLGSGTGNDLWRPSLPALPQGAKWEDVTAVNGEGIPGGSETYTIRVEADSAFMDVLEADPGCVIGWREALEPLSMGVVQVRPRGAVVLPGDFTDFANDLVTAGLYPDIPTVEAVFGLSVNDTWSEVTQEGIVNQVTIANQP